MNGSGKLLHAAMLTIAWPTLEGGGGGREGGREGGRKKGRKGGREGGAEHTHPVPSSSPPLTLIYSPVPSSSPCVAR